MLRKRVVERQAGLSGLYIGRGRSIAYNKDFEGDKTLTPESFDDECYVPVAQ